MKVLSSLASPIINSDLKKLITQFLFSYRCKSVMVNTNKLTKGSDDESNYFKVS